MLSSLEVCGACVIRVVHQGVRVQSFVGLDRHAESAWREKNAVLSTSDDAASPLFAKFAAQPGLLSMASLLLFYEPNLPIFVVCRKSRLSGGHMDLKRLSTFVAVAEHGTVSKAAAVLHITQPALSRQISSPRAGIRLRAVRAVGPSAPAHGARRATARRMPQPLARVGALGERARALRAATSGSEGGRLGADHRGDRFRLSCAYAERMPGGASR